ncbi:MAG: type III pantothenate kinase [Akkermansiaceae bacterium]|nr:type III pantothenate kinase [Akkermansiaceae bacterium]
MRILIVDNSNTRTKFALASPGELLPWRAIIPTPEISPESLGKALKGIDWDVSIISSVVPEKAAILSSWLGDKPCHQLDYQSKLPISISYPQPGQIGADRLANAAGAYDLYGSPCIVLDFGTAVTFDVIAPDAQVTEETPADDHKGVYVSSEASAKGEASYQGGVIAPGLASMTEGLARRTALLPHIELEEPKHAIGKSTEEAMLAGAVFGYRGLVREILLNLRKELPANPVVVATGGDAALITRGLPEITKLAPHLTLDGLRIIASLNF